MRAGEHPICSSLEPQPTPETTEYLLEDLFMDSATQVTFKGPVKGLGDIMTIKILLSILSLALKKDV